MIFQEIAVEKAMQASTEVLKFLESQNPYEIFQSWLKQAEACPLIKQPTAMLLSTSVDNRPHARIVLLKEVLEGSFIFYTNYNSVKGKDLAKNPSAQLTFYWDALAKQVHIQGSAQKVPRAASQAYWRSRPRASQISQWISKQSEVAPSREELEQLALKAQAQFEGKEIPCPDHWGGYALKPSKFEFWIGRESRLHDRFVFEPESEKDQTSWQVHRLFP